MKWNGLNWIHVYLLSEHWRALANAVLNIGGSFICGEILDQLNDISF